MGKLVKAIKNFDNLGRHGNQYWHEINRKSLEKLVFTNIVQFGEELGIFIQSKI